MASYVVITQGVNYEKKIPMLESVYDVAENLPKRFRDLFIIELDFSVESIEHIERIIAAFPHDDEPAIVEKMNELLVAIGCYVGEVIRRNFGGEWQDTSNVNGFPIGIKLGSKYLNPIDKVRLRHEFGGKHNLSNYVRSSVLMKVNL
jgi:hypothetical protein